MAKGMSEKRLKKVADYYSNKIKDIEILIDNVHDPHNVAAVARSADGLGIETINLYYTFNPYPDMKKNGKKSSSTANKWIKFNKISNLNEFARQKKKEGYIFLGMDQNEKSISLNKFDFPDKCILIFGSEHKGISSELREICNKFIFIPMVGMVESYNISVAAALSMYEIYKQKGNNLKLKE